MQFHQTNMNQGDVNISIDADEVKMLMTKKTAAEMEQTVNKLVSYVRTQCCTNCADDECWDELQKAICSLLRRKS